MQLTRFFRQSWVNGCLAIALGLAATIIVLQARSIRALQSDLDQTFSGGHIPVGTSIPQLQLEDLDGKRLTMRFSDSGRPILLYVFQPHCVWCQKNGDSILSLANQVSRDYRVVGLSLVRDDLTTFVKLHNMTFPVYYVTSPSTLTKIHIASTPETILLSVKGTILDSWDGAYSGGTKTALERVFAIRLPSELDDIRKYPQSLRLAR